MTTTKAVGDTPRDGLARLVLGSADLRDDQITPALLDMFASGGGRAIDLANVYNAGESNRAVGRWLPSGGVEPRLFVKGCHPPRCSPDLVRAEVDTARGDLAVDALDVFILHRDDEVVPVGAFGEALLAEVARGSIATFGVSNWTFARYAELANILAEDRDRLTVFSNQFSLATMATPDVPGCRDMD
jgi:aryl-alcohol dehydrogenase-like predicted oxidoreductase